MKIRIPSKHSTILLPITGKLGLLGVKQFILYDYIYGKIYALYECVLLYKVHWNKNVGRVE